MSGGGKVRRYEKQLELDLPGLVEVPWGGVSPRALTRGFDVVIFPSRGGDVSLPPITEQYDLFEPLKGRRPEGAPSLLPLPPLGVRRRFHWGTRGYHG